MKYGKLIGAGSLAVALFFAWLYTPLGPEPLALIEWLFVIGWFVVLGVLAVYAKYNYNLTRVEREKLLFSEH